ncbi:MAG: hypothetical protein WBO58_19580 [Gammaproteobacteria bacterium]
MKPTKSLHTIILALTLLALTACATSKPSVEWRSESFTGKVDNIMIIGVSEDAERRYTFENTFVEVLAANKTRAIPSRNLLPTSINLRREIVEKAIEGQQVDAVLITRVAGVRATETNSVADFGDDYVYYNLIRRETNQAYPDEHKLFTLESRLYDTASGELIWSMRSETMADAKPKENIENQIRLTTRALTKSGLIAAKP